MGSEDGRRLWPMASAEHDVMFPGWVGGGTGVLFPVWDRPRCTGSTGSGPEGWGGFTSFLRILLPRQGSLGAPPLPSFSPPCELSPINLG